MQYIQYSPPDELKSYVRYFWSFDAWNPQLPKLHIKSFADKYPRLIFQNLHHFEPIRNLQGDPMPVCYLSGIDIQPTDAIMGGAFSHFGVSFYPHALTAFFTIEASELINQMPDIQLLCGSEIHHQLEQASTHLQRVQLLSKYLYDKLYISRTNDLLINHLIQCHDITDQTYLHLLHKKYNLSERQLQRRFKAQVGIPPKKLQRLLRFERSLQLLAQTEYSQLTSLAYELNYTDQSHFIKDFQAFSGMSPYAFVKNRSIGSESSSFIYIPE